MTGQMMPIALSRLPLAGDSRRIRALPARRAALRRADQRDAAFVVARNDRINRMAEAVAVARLRQRQARLDRVEENRA